MHDKLGSSEAFRSPLQTVPETQSVVCPSQNPPSDESKFHCDISGETASRSVVGIPLDPNQMRSLFIV